MMDLKAKRHLRDFNRLLDEIHSLIRKKEHHSILEVLALYDELSGKLYSLRSHYDLDHPKRLEIEDQFNQITLALLPLRSTKPRSSPFQDWLNGYRSKWHIHSHLFFFTLLFFISTILVGWAVVRSDPTYASVIIPQATLEDILSKSKWFERIQSNPLLHGGTIAVNNIKVAFNAFLLGALLGLGGLVVLAFNGIMVGAITAFCTTYDFHKELLTFMTAHGALELSLIVASAFAGLVFGRVFYMKPRSLFRRRLALAASDASTLISGILPWFVFAACIEVFISPWPFISLPLRISIATFGATVFWVWSSRKPTTALPL